jgi:hypothetical protein
MAYAAKIERSHVRLVNTSNGSTVRTIPGDYTNAVVQGDEAHLTQGNGRIRVVNIKTGATIRTI